MNEEKRATSIDPVSVAKNHCIHASTLGLGDAIVINVEEKKLTINSEVYEWADGDAPGVLFQVFGSGYTYIEESRVMRYRKGDNFYLLKVLRASLDPMQYVVVRYGPNSRHAKTYEKEKKEAAKQSKIYDKEYKVRAKLMDGGMSWEDAWERTTSFKKRESLRQTTLSAGTTTKRKRKTR